ncbi:MAG: HlyD family secretion protein [Bacteroidales bacterium]
MNRNNNWAYAIIIVAALAIVSLAAWFAIKPVPTLIQGQVVSTSVKVSSKLPGRIDSLFVREGQSVTKGEPLFILSTPEVNAKLQQAEAVRQAAKAQDSKAKFGARSEEVQAVYNLWQKAEAGYELADKSFTRIERLYKSGVVTAQKFDEVSANRQAMEATRQAAKAQYEMALKGAREEDKSAAAALLNQADAVVAEVSSMQSDARQYAPFDAEVATIIAEEGELIGAGYPVITLVNLNDSYISFNVKEDLLPKIKVGKSVKGFVPALDEDINLSISAIAVQAEYATWSATRTKGEFDIRTFEVKMRPEKQRSDLRPGMSVVVNWDTIE